MLAQWLDETQILSHADAQKTLSSVFQPDFAIQIGISQEHTIHWLRSRFVSVGRDVLNDRLTVLAPLGPSGLPLLEVGQEILVYYHIEERGYALYTRVAKLTVEAFGDADAACARLATPRTAYRFQRREYNRVKPTEVLPVTIRWGHEEGASEEYEASAILEDISLGGARIRIDDFDMELADALQVRPPLQVSVLLPMDGTSFRLQTHAETVRCVRELKPRRAVWLGVKWEELGRDAQRALSRFIMAQEREMLKKRREALEVRRMRSKG